MIRPLGLAAAVVLLAGCGMSNAASPHPTRTVTASPSGPTSDPTTPAAVASPAPIGMPPSSYGHLIAEVHGTGNRVLHYPSTITGLQYSCAGQGVQVVGSTSYFISSSSCAPGFVNGYQPAKPAASATVTASAQTQWIVALYNDDNST